MNEVMIADSSLVFSLELKAQLGADISVRSCHNAAELMEMLKTAVPDLLVMDISLPGCDGLELLRRITTMPEHPAVLVTVDYVSDFVKSALAGMGIGYLMVKPVKIAYAAARVQEMLNFYRENPVPQDLLQQVCVSEKLSGAKYIRYALPFIMANPDLQMTKELYPLIGAKFGKTPKSVERCIRNAVHTTWERHDGFIWQAYLETDRNGRCRRPSNSEFFGMLLRMIRKTG